jgi:hypothetical protein
MAGAGGDAGDSGVVARPIRTDLRAPRGRVLLRGEALHRDVDECGIAGAGIAVREADLEHLGDQMEVLRGAEAEPARIEALEDVQHLDEVQSARGGRRSARDLEAAIAAADGRPLDRLVAREIIERDDATRAAHVVRHRRAKVATVEHAGALRRDQTQRGRVLRHRDQITGLDGRAAGQEGARGLGKARQVGRALPHRLHQIWRGAEAALRVADRGLHHGLEIEAAEPSDGLGPGHQRAGHAHREQADEVDVALHSQIVGPGVGDRHVHVGARGRRRGGVVVDDEVPAVGQPQVGHARAEDAHHHRLHHGQREERGDGRVHRIAARREHLGPRCRAERMIADHHAA